MVDAALSVEDQPPPAPSGRIARKRAQARARILAAAEQLMRGGAVDTVTIADITAAADVGHGTFYLHFQTKHDVLLPILEADAGRWDAHMLPQLEALDDPARVMSVALRFAGRCVLADSLWRWFLANSNVPVDDMQRLFSRYCGRDLERGVASGRFSVPDAARASNAFGFGGYLCVLQAALEDDAPLTQIDTGAELILRALGVPAAEAQALAHAGDPVLAALLASAP